jgi:hypothetical protein
MLVLLMRTAEEDLELLDPMVADIEKLDPDEQRELVAHLQGMAAQARAFISMAHFGGLAALSDPTVHPRHRNGRRIAEVRRSHDRKGGGFHGTQKPDQDDP